MNKLLTLVLSLKSKLPPKVFYTLLIIALLGGSATTLCSATESTNTVCSILSVLQ